MGWGQGHRGDARGGGEGELVGDAAADARGDLGGRAEQADRGGDVEEGLVQGERLDERSEGLEDGEDLLAGGGVDVHARGHHYRRGSELEGLRHAHRAPYAEAADLVRRRQHHAAPRVATDDDGLAAKLPPVALLDRGVERVHVDVQDGAQSGGRRHAQRLPPPPAKGEL